MLQPLGTCHSLSMSWTSTPLCTPLSVWQLIPFTKDLAVLHWLPRRLPFLRRNYHSFYDSPIVVLATVHPTAPCLPGCSGSGLHTAPGAKKLGNYLFLMLSVEITNCRIGSILLAGPRISLVFDSQNSDCKNILFIVAPVPHLKQNEILHRTSYVR